MADIASGEWWRIDEYGTLYIYCDGEMPSVEWGGYENDITAVEISNSVTTIVYAAFKDCASLTGVTIPNSVISIEGAAFYDCSALANVTIPSDVTSIEDETFSGCTSLTNVTIPNGVASIGGYAFYGCSSLAGVTIPNSVTSIGNSAFMECSALTSVTIPDGVTNIGKGAFNGCSSLTSVTIPGGVTSVSDAAFSECENLSSATIQEGVTWIGEQSFVSCANLTSVTIPASVTSIYYEAFYGCENLTDVYYAGSQRQWEAIEDDSSERYYLMENVGATIHYAIPCDVFVLMSDDGWRLESDGTLYISGDEYGATPYSFDNMNYGWRVKSVVMSDNITGISSGAFQNFNHIVNVTIPDGVTQIEDNAFHDCVSLTNVTIPDSVEFIGYAAFDGCSALTDVYYSGTREQWNDNISIWNRNDPLVNATIHFKEEPMPEQETRNPQRVVYGIVPPDTFQQLILEAGILVTNFDPETGTYSGFIGATSGGVSFNANPNDVDFGEDVDGAPANTMQLRRRTHYDPVLSGTLVSMDDDTPTKLIGAADSEDITAATNTANASKTGLTPSPSTTTITSLKRVTPSEDILSGDFIPHLWLIADYTNNHNASVNAGCVAIHLKNAFNTTGLQIQTQKNQKGTLPFEFHAHYDITDVTAVPFELYIRNGPIYNATTP